MDTKLDLVISRFVPLGFELMAIGIKVNKFSILYIVNKRHDITEHKNMYLVTGNLKHQILYHVNYTIFLYPRHQTDVL
jgi:hypothetical protein